MNRCTIMGWREQSQTTMGAQSMRGRLTMKVRSATAYNFKFEVSPDGTSWTTVLEGKATKESMAAESPGQAFVSS